MPITDRTLAEFITCSALVTEAEEIVERDGVGGVHGTARRLARERFFDNMEDDASEHKLHPPFELPYGVDPMDYDTHAEYAQAIERAKSRT